ncbi:MAG: hypothetical protein JWM68_2774 [Verrucomicrobiales bacterium]|nr:hypothetical protein [Verrucomicrobiales bacterium]
MARTTTQSNARPQTTATTASTNSWFGIGLFITILAFLIAATYPEIIFKGHVFVYRDAGIFNYPTHFFAAESWRGGEAPLWNPWNNCGIPFLAQWNVMALYPLSIIFTWFPGPQAITYFSLLHFFIAGVGMYFLAYRWTNNRFAASVAGLAFAWNGLTLHALMWPNSCASIGWAPWVLFFVDKALRLGGRNIIYAALVGAMQMLAGVPEIILITWAIAGALFLFEFIRGDVARGRLALRFFSSGLLVGGLTAAQMFPFLDLLMHSQRNTSYSDIDVWAMPMWGWANFFVPLFRTSTSFQGVHLQTEQQWTSSYYLGIGIMALAIIGMLRSRNPRTWLLVGITVFGCVLALGKSAVLYTILQKVFPLVGFMRYPAKWVQLAMFCVPLLAAFGIASLQNESAERSRKSMFTIGGLFLGIMVFVVGCAFMFVRVDEPGRLALQNAAMRAVFLVLILGALYQAIHLEEVLWKNIFGVAVLLLIGLDVSTHMPRQHPTVLAAAYKPVDLQMKEVPQLGLGRAMISPDLQTTMRRAGSPIIAEDYRVKRLVLFGNANILDHVPKVNGMFSLYTKEQADIEKKLSDSQTKSPGLGAFVGVSQFCIQPRVDTFSWRWVSRDNLPMLTLGQKPVFADSASTLEALSSERFNPTEVVYLPPEASSVITATNFVKGANILADEKFKIAPPKVTAREVSFTVSTPEPAMVVMAQTFYHAWKASVDGKPTPIYRANHAFQAIEVPGGQHVITFVYDDQMFKNGVNVSIGTLVICVIAWFLLKRKSPVTV